VRARESTMPNVHVARCSERASIDRISSWSMFCSRFIAAWQRSSSK
jgi:hypothetical protein